MISKLKFLILGVSCLLFQHEIIANNIVVSNVTLTGRDVTAGFTMVRFDITWDNSWKTSSGPANYDAAWVFVKYRVGNGPWQHASLNNTGHTAGNTDAIITTGLLTPGANFDASTNPGLGVFISRNADGIGTFTSTGNQLRWNYGVNGVTDGANVDVKVFAIEMVYITTGSFNVGGGGGTNAFTSTTINTSDATSIPSGVGILGGQQGGYPTGAVAPTSNSWPNGYSAFYCMKYEISQGQYRDFLNTLTRAQQINRVTSNISTAGTLTNTYVLSNTSSISRRNTIRCNSPLSSNSPIVFFCDYDGNQNLTEEDGEAIACNFLGWTDGCAYSDWAGLRPMTEMEYEKACRGANQLPVANEYAWGTTSIPSAKYTLSNPGLVNENIATNYIVSTSIGNASCRETAGNLLTDIYGPMRVGIFAGNISNTTRITSGASYYGVMELSGNLMERTVTITYLSGRSFTGVHGNGMLLSTGNADVDFWPGINGNTNPDAANLQYNPSNGVGVTGSAGGAWRDGSWNSSGGSEMRVSNRSNALMGGSTTRDGTYGFRAVRSAQ